MRNSNARQRGMEKPLAIHRLALEALFPLRLGKKVGYLWQVDGLEKVRRKEGFPYLPR
jgi:hypothetical protein